MIANPSKISQKQLTLVIAVPCPLPQLFHYLPQYQLNNEDFIKKLQPGIRVKIPFGKRELIGIFLNVEYDSPIDPKKLRKIIAVIDDKPLFDDDMLHLLRWLSDYYHYPLGEVFAIAMPTLLCKGNSCKRSSIKYWELSSLGKTIDRTSLKRSPKQAKIIQILLDTTKIVENELSDFNINRGSIKKLLEKKLIIERQIYNDPTLSSIQVESPKLNVEQAKIVESIVKKGFGFNVFLIDGITGSGKTEVYFQIIQELLTKKKQVLVLVPEIGLTPQTVQRFQQRFSNPLAVMHSELSDKERLDHWILAQECKINILIGTRSALFTPMPNLGLIIVDEEHDSSFKQQDGLRYSARDAAVVLAKQKNIPIILGSATPSLESYHNVYSNRYHYYALTSRAGVAVLPRIQLVDLRNQKLIEGLTTYSLQKIKEHLSLGNQVLLFLNRRGFSPNLLCHSCGHIFSCQRCDKAYTYHQSKAKLICHHCERQLTKPSYCPVCGKEKLIPLGLGTERIEAALQAYYPAESIVRIDRDSTRMKGSFNALLKQINSGVYKILIGTQMLAKGHHFPKVTLVIIVNADSGLLSNDLRASERMGQLITQVSGRSGRAEKPGEVLIQTHQIDHPHLQCLIKQPYQQFARILMEERKQSNLPPYSYLALFRADAFSIELTFNFLNKIKQEINLFQLNCTVFGPVPAPHPKKAGKFRSQLLIQANQRKTLQFALDQLFKLINNIELSKKVKWSLDVDPLELL